MPTRSRFTELWKADVIFNLNIKRYENEVDIALRLLPHFFIRLCLYKAVLYRCEFIFKSQIIGYHCYKF